MKKYFALIFLALSSVQVQSSEINKCEVNGKVVYTDQPCTKSATGVVNLKPINTIPTTTPTLSISTVPDNQNAEPYNSKRWYVDRDGYYQALRVSRKWQAPIFIYAYVDWCKFCRKFEAQLLPTPEAQKTLSSYVKVRINPEHSAEDEALFNQWDGTGYPTLFIKNTASSPPRNQGSPFLRDGLMSPEKFSQRFQNSISVQITPID
ncbi:MAG: thioredoxin family protein [Halioglobus sp.]